ncbi:MAG: SPOR domain-containing protein [Gammaproteobacteria bacterium]|nr:SPOR domain-containing protein [Gammaproteobacteria bacterium]MDH5240116.1 SPOR domain-containing protein [Gammaproteobacteria bacterium]MDH5582932.1 SPOR domain-containing protein [Gammaproteobacteria bacterium]
MNLATLTRAAKRIGACCTVSVLLFAAAPSLAGPGFISTAQVSVDDSDVSSFATISIRFKCKAQYLSHTPDASSDRLRIFLEPTTICNGAPPTVAESQSRMRPYNSDSAHLTELEYDGDATVGPVLTLSFSEPVSYDIEMSGLTFDVDIHVRKAADNSGASVVNESSTSPATARRQVVQPKRDTGTYVVNLVSLKRIPTIADAPDLVLQENQKLYYSEALVNGATWYRLRVGNFDSPATARDVLVDLIGDYPGAWIDQLESGSVDTDLTVAAQQSQLVSEPLPDDMSGNAKVDALMEDARRSIISGDTSRAIQIYTKVLQLPPNSRQVEAQEFLAIAREKNGQTAHAKAEYQRYLSLYPNSEGAERVSQRLAALLANSGPASVPSGATSTGDRILSARRSDWRIQTYFSQYYRRDVNQPNDQEEIVSQSALYSDVNFDARYRGERFDFSSRVSAGHRNDFLENTSSTTSGNSTRISYAYADLADVRTGLRGRFGRQSRNSGGVLGRFDGFNLDYQLNEKLMVSGVIGKPAYSTSDGIDSSRSFYGVSVEYGPVITNLDVGLYYLQQQIESVRDRQAVGGEFRYFGPNQNLWGMVDYDLQFGELASAFLQGSWRFESRLSVHASANRRGSPFLSTGNAIIGQPVETFAELAEIFSAAELVELGRDRTAASTNFSVGLSYPLTRRFQISADLGQSDIDETPASGGVLATPASSYGYYSGSLIASSLLTEGDVTILTARFSDSDTSDVATLTLDSRFPLGRSWRLNPRIRVDRRQVASSPGVQWLYTPGIRIQYRRSQSFRVELEAGKLFSQQDSIVTNQQRDSYFVNLGYQVFF